MDFNRHALKTLRVKRRWTLKAAAAEVGVSRQTLSYLERGVVKPSSRTLGKLSGAFGVPVDRFYSRGA